MMNAHAAAAPKTEEKPEKSKPAATVSEVIAEESASIKLRRLHLLDPKVLSLVDNKTSEEKKTEEAEPPNQDEKTRAEREKAAAEPANQDEKMRAEREKAAAEPANQDEKTRAEREKAAAEPANQDEKMRAEREKAAAENMVGLSFSGGGIRSGTFAVGFLQGLAALRLLRRIDYLSTVSGGGYAGGWFAAWLKRDGDPRNVEKQLMPNRCCEATADRVYLSQKASPVSKPDDDDPCVPGLPVVDEEPEPLHHLRRFSSYMAPRLGWLTVDTWTIIAIWTRNVAINLLMLFPLAACLVLSARLVVAAFAQIGSKAIVAPVFTTREFAWAFAALGLICLVGALCCNAFCLRGFRQGPSSWGKSIREFTKKHMNWTIVYPVLAATVLLGISIRAIVGYLGASGTKSHGWVGMMIAGAPGVLQAPNILSHGFFLGILLSTVAFAMNRKNWKELGSKVGTFLILGWLVCPVAAIAASLSSPVIPPAFVYLFWPAFAVLTIWLIQRSGVRRYMFASFMAGMTAGLLLTLLESLANTFESAARPDLSATFFPPLALLIVTAAGTVEVALMGRAIGEPEREWWARFSALLLVAGAFWLLAFGSILYVPAAFLAVGIPARTALASSWITTTVFGILAGRKARPTKRGRRDPLGTVAAVAPPIFLIGLLGLTALLVARLVNEPVPVFPDSGKEWIGLKIYFQGIFGASVWTLTAYLLLSASLALFAARLIDVNLFSLHAMYANRLTRCYLGASRPKKAWKKRWDGIHDQTVCAGAPSLKPGDPPMVERDADPVTGFDPDDDMPLHALAIGREDETPGGRRYWGPHLLINTTLNLVGGTELAWRDRKGESFTITPSRCGSKSVGYAKTTKSAGETLTLGRAIAISGAALDPNMKYDQSAALTAFLTIFNARLGYWMRNPNREGWKAESPEYGDRLLYELTGRTDNTDEYVHLSDGGHFENLGVYELVRRRCRFVIAVDAGEDVEADDDNLAELIRLCRIDFGVRIELHTHRLKPEGPNRRVRSHFAIGEIRYDDVDVDTPPGIIVYVKSSLTGDEPADVLHYADKDNRFPNQPTDLRQSFDEEQFESYRALGDHIARVVFEDAVNEVKKEDSWSKPTTLDAYERDNERLFRVLRDRARLEALFEI